jgi:hypothetical protein
VLAGAVCGAQAETSKQMKFEIEVPPEIAAHGITMLRATDPEAAKYIEKILRSEQLGVDERPIAKVLLPYAVLLVNGSGARLLQTTVGISWPNLNYPATWPPRHTLINNINCTWKDYPPSQMPAGAAWMFVPQRGLNMHFNQPWGTKQDSIDVWADKIAQMARDFGQVPEMCAFIDSVTIEGVGLVGPDKGSIRSRGQNVKNRGNNAEGR